MQAHHDFGLKRTQACRIVLPFHFRDGVVFAQRGAAGELLASLRDVKLLARDQRRLRGDILGLRAFANEREPRGDGGGVGFGLSETCCGDFMVGSQGQKLTRGNLIVLAHQKFCDELRRALKIRQSKRRDFFAWNDAAIGDDAAAGH